MDIFNWVLSSYLFFGQFIPSDQQEIVKYGGMQVLHADGSVTLRMKEVSRNEISQSGARHVAIRLRDEAYPFEVVRHVRKWDDCEAVETWVEIRHDEPGPVRLLKMDSFAAAVPVKADEVRVLSLTGAWAREAGLVESPVGNGQILHLSSRSGVRDAWESNAAMMVSFDEVTERKGKVLGVALEWTGTTSRSVRRTWNGKVTEVFAGVDQTTGPYVLDPGTVLELPRAILVWSEKGRGGVSRAYHRWARRHLMPHGDDLHPVLLNSWEGSYFSFTEKTLTDMMDGVRELGGEMFVLDDGWFGWGKYARDEVNKATAGLGDWRVNRKKLPRGLGWLSDEAKRRGLKFGLWIEPEMTNVKSHLADAHPDWILREPRRPLVLGRGGTQVVLDFCNPTVRSDIEGQLEEVFAGIPDLAYIKWDSNQNIVNPGSTYLKADRQANLWFDYTKGVYDFLGRMRARRPHIMLQACSSGGGHMDFGFLRYADEFWTSDCTDPHRRVFIQWGASQFYPASAMACHVTDSPNHQTKRVTPIKYRFDVAMTGRLGFELYPGKLTAEELAFSKAAVADYKRIRPIVQRGDLYRLVSPYDGRFASLMYVDGDRSRAVVFLLGLDRDQALDGKLVLDGLDPSFAYTVGELTPKGAAQPCAGKTFRGEELMSNGLEYSISGKYASFALLLEKNKKPVSGYRQGTCSSRREPISMRMSVVSRQNLVKYTAR